MHRKDFLKNFGLGTTLLPMLTSCGEDDVDSVKDAGACAVTDSETDGPYPLYNSRGSSINRVDVTDGKQGLPLSITITVKNVNDNCNILENARVDIWHCDKDGYYSGYSNTGFLGTQNNTSQVFCRGLQYSDANGEVKFVSIYPGWYPGRVTHIHVQVYAGSELKLTSQIAFPEEINTEVYNSAPYVDHGQNPTKNSTDNIISDSLDNELAVVVKNESGGYDLTHTLFISA